MGLGQWRNKWKKCKTGTGYTGIERIRGQRKPKLSSVSQIRLTITYGFHYIALFMDNIRVLKTISCDGPGISEYRFELKRGRGIQESLGGAVH